MNKTAIKSLTLCFLAIALTALALGGCARKRISSSPPAHRPAQTRQAEPAPKPKVVEAEPVVIEETYVVDAPEENGAPAVRVEEEELAEETLPEPVQAEAISTETVAVQPEAEEPVITEPKAPTETATEEVVPMAEMYYVQVGAFSQQENANAVLAQLTANGYKGSKFVKTASGLYRVQAGAFAEKEDAEAARDALLEEFPNSFILKETPVQ